MIKGFKEFIMQGNVIDLAVAVVIGSAFTALVNSVVESVINPVIQLFWKADDSGNVGFPIQGLYGEVIFPVGNLLNAVITFFAVAVVVYFVFVVPMNALKARQAARAGVATPEPEAPTEQELLTEIRDLLAKNAAKQ